MSMHRTAALQAGLLLVAMFANAASRDNTIRIKVLDYEAHSVSLEGTDVPKNCDQVNFDAYCNNSKTSLLTNILLVQEGNDPPFRIACTVDSKWSRCVLLDKGESFDAKKGKRGLTVYYIDDKGKARSQLYTLVDAEGKARLPVSAAAVQPVPAVAAPQQSPPVPAPTSAPAPPPPSTAAVTGDSSRETVKCSFSSTPPGAEITVDGRYSGNTPSVLGLTMGTHVVVLFAPGFAQWKKELTVSSGSEVTVNASLQKLQ